MSDDKIAEIRKRHLIARTEIDQYGAYRFDGYTYQGSLSQSQEDLDTALAEVDRQRAQIERLREALEYIVNVCPAIDPDGDQAHERARKALEGKL